MATATASPVLLSHHQLPSKVWTWRVTCRKHDTHADFGSDKYAAALASICPSEFCEGCADEERERFRTVIPTGDVCPHDEQRAAMERETEDLYRRLEEPVR